MADTDNETVEDSHMKPMIYCLTCGHIFNLPAWMKNHVLITDKAAMLNSTKAVVKEAKAAIRRRSKGNSR